MLIPALGFVECVFIYLVSPSLFVFLPLSYSKFIDQDMEWGREREVWGLRDEKVGGWEG